MEEIKTISIDDRFYPRLLKEIKNPPKVIYYKGKLFPEENCFAIVGTRRCSPYGKQIAIEFAGDLCEANLTIVSGLAPGIDTACHQTVVERKKRTIAVLGTGIDEKSIYPQINLKLSRKILEQNGAIISEYPPGTPGSKFSFPQRNRIISGLSLGTLVVEAKEKSGALITANFAISQKRKLFAIPGPIHSLNSKGPNHLIKNGSAKLVNSSQDILKDLDLSFSETKEAKISGENEQENIILETLEEESLHIDKIIEKTKISAAKIAGTLAILEIKCKVRNLGGNIYSIFK